MSPGQVLCLQQADEEYAEALRSIRFVLLARLRCEAATLVALVPAARDDVAVLMEACAVALGQVG